MTENLVHFPNGKVESFTVFSVVSSLVFIQHLIRIEIKFSIFLQNFKNPNSMALLILRPLFYLFKKVTNQLPFSGARLRVPSHIFNFWISISRRNIPEWSANVIKCEAAKYLKALTEVSAIVSTPIKWRTKTICRESSIPLRTGVCWITATLVVWLDINSSCIVFSSNPQKGWQLARDLLLRKIPTKMLTNSNCKVS